MFLFICDIHSQNISVCFSLPPRNLKHFIFINIILKFEITLEKPKFYLVGSLFTFV
jgi:hypothetical protein